MNYVAYVTWAVLITVNITYEPSPLYVCFYELTNARKGKHPYHPTLHTPRNPSDNT